MSSEEKLDSENRRGARDASEDRMRHEPWAGPFESHEDYDERRDAYNAGYDNTMRQRDEGSGILPGERSKKRLQNEARSESVRESESRPSDASDDDDTPWAISLMVSLFVIIFSGIVLILGWIIKRPWRVAVAVLVIGGIAIISLLEQRPREAPVREGMSPVSAPQPTAASSDPATVLPAGSRSTPAEGSFLRPITDPGIAHNLTRQIRKTSLDRDPIVVVSLDGKEAWINLRGTNVDLPLAALEGVPDNAKVGNRFSRKFTKDDVSLIVQYEVLSSFVSQEMGCEHTDYKVSVELSGTHIKERLEPESYGEGC